MSDLVSKVKDINQYYKMRSDISFWLKKKQLIDVDIIGLESEIKKHKQELLEMENQIKIVKKKEYKMKAVLDELY
ncbi:MAG: hypothetical protein ACRCRU_00450 [Vibrio sp.]|uniref:hypothetical protein n=1 Tax=Vibrio TaxID=662 RepID=UPI00140AC3C2|nr:MULTISPECIES: hypothetical protein [unclassified Vibrio]QIL85666.1 hypothetical protein G7083_07245 [Vibrio sp. HDW18]